jgi:hypothetical protein
MSNKDSKKYNKRVTSKSIEQVSIVGDRVVVKSMAQQLKKVRNTSEGFDNVEHTQALLYREKKQKSKLQERLTIRKMSSKQPKGGNDVIETSSDDDDGDKYDLTPLTGNSLNVPDSRKSERVSHKRPVITSIEAVAFVGDRLVTQSSAADFEKIKSSSRDVMISSEEAQNAAREREEQRRRVHQDRMRARLKKKSNNAFNDIGVDELQEPNNKDSSSDDSSSEFATHASNTLVHQSSIAAVEFSQVDFLFPNAVSNSTNTTISSPIAAKLNDGFDSGGDSENGGDSLKQLPHVEPKQLKALDRRETDFDTVAVPKGKSKSRGQANVSDGFDSGGDSENGDSLKQLPHVEPKQLKALDSRETDFDTVAVPKGKSKSRGQAKVSDDHYVVAENPNGGINGGSVVVTNNSKDYSDFTKTNSNYQISDPETKNQDEPSSQRVHSHLFDALHSDFASLDQPEYEISDSSDKNGTKKKRQQNKVNKKIFKSDGAVDTQHMVTSNRIERGRLPEVTAVLSLSKMNPMSSKSKLASCSNGSGTDNIAGTSLTGYEGEHFNEMREKDEKSPKILTKSPKLIKKKSTTEKIHSFEVEEISDNKLILDKESRKIKKKKENEKKTQKKKTQEINNLEEELDQMMALMNIKKVSMKVASLGQSKKSTKGRVGLVLTKAASEDQKINYDLSDDD